LEGCKELHLLAGTEEEVAHSQPAQH